MEPESVKFERVHETGGQVVAPAVLPPGTVPVNPTGGKKRYSSGRHPLLLYNGRAFDSCFPLRD
jgi:hypothetical protein